MLSTHTHTHARDFCLAINVRESFWVYFGPVAIITLFTYGKATGVGSDRDYIPKGTRSGQIKDNRRQ